MSRMPRAAPPCRCRHDSPLLRMAARCEAGSFARNNWGKPAFGKTLTSGDDRLHELGDRAHLELLHEPGAVGLDGLDADLEGLGDLAVELARHHQVEDLALALRELFEAPREHAAPVTPR